MHTKIFSRFSFLLSLLVSSLAGAQADLPVAPAPTSPWPTASKLEHAADQPVPLEKLLLAHAPELILVPELRGVIFVADPADAKSAPPAGFHGIDATKAPVLRSLPVEDGVKLFLGQPASLPSLGRLASIVQVWLQQQGDSFATAYVPPQDLTDGVVRVVVTRSRLEGDVAIEGAKYFSLRQYRDAFPLASGGEIDAAELRAATDALNQNPYRQVKAVVGPGGAPGTSRVALQVEEQRPWRVTAGYSNAGSPSIGEDQLSAGFTWGNAFGRGDVFNYNFASDPQAEHMTSHSGSYAMFLRNRRTLTFSGAWSKIVGDLPAPLAQTGHSWSMGARYGLPLRSLREGWTQNLTFSADFKSSDNNLEFAAIPITNNTTHVAQLGTSYSLSFRGLGGENSIAVAGYASPGGLTRYNKTSAFSGSRLGAKADYAYGTLNLAHQQSLPFGFSWNASVTAQVASGALLGSEQLAGAGANAVRGYVESGAFGDGGVIVSNELHARGLPVWRGHDRLDLFAFADLASLNLQVNRESTDLRSVGVGANYSLGRHVSLRASYGWQLTYLDASNEKSHAHLGANVSF